MLINSFVLILVVVRCVVLLFFFFPDGETQFLLTTGTTGAARKCVWKTPALLKNANKIYGSAEKRYFLSTPPRQVKGVPAVEGKTAKTVAAVGATDAKMCRSANAKHHANVSATGGEGSGGGGAGDPSSGTESDTVLLLSRHLFRVAANSIIFSDYIVVLLRATTSSANYYYNKNTFFP